MRDDSSFLSLVESQDFEFCKTETLMESYARMNNSGFFEQFVMPDED